MPEAGGCVRGLFHTPFAEPPGLAQRVAWPVIRGWCRWKVRRDLRMRIAGGRFVPRLGPALIVCNHYHHLYDGCALIAAIRRPVRIVVALDWAPDRRTRLLMETACGAARWPVLLRGERVTAAGGAYAPGEVRSYVRRGLREAVALLRAGEIVAIFPEGYPAIDPTYTPKTEAYPHLPFREGFALLLERAQRGGAAIPLIPAGIEYSLAARGQSEATLRFGEPIRSEGRVERGALARTLAAQVRALSGG